MKNIDVINETKNEGAWLEISVYKRSSCCCSFLCCDHAATIVKHTTNDEIYAINFGFAQEYKCSEKGLIKRIKEGKFQDPITFRIQEKENRTFQTFKIECDSRYNSQDLDEYNPCFNNCADAAKFPLIYFKIKEEAYQKKNCIEKISLTIKYSCSAFPFFCATPTSVERQASVLRSAFPSATPPISQKMKI